MKILSNNYLNHQLLVCLSSSKNNNRDNNNNNNNHLKDNKDKFPSANNSRKEGEVVKKKI